MTKELFIQAITKFLGGVALLGLLIFLPAGTFHYWQGWLLMGILFIPMFIAGLVMMKKNPELLKKRLNAKEEEKEQKQVIIFSGLMFLAAFVLAGLNFRFQWLLLPDWAVWAAAVLFLLAYALYAEVLRENTYLSRTIEVQEEQKVIDTGLYGIVRHPMYAATLVLFLSMPLVLASPLSFLVMLAYIPIINKRMSNEEEVLRQGLKGYNAYRAAGCGPRKPDVGDLLLAVSDTNIAAQNAVTAAWSLGIGSCYIGDIMENIETQREILSLPRYVFPAAMVVFGYPTDQQRDREKPRRFDNRFTVQENAYHPLFGEELRQMFADRTAARGFEDWIRAFHTRKYDSGFSREMSRSVRKVLEEFGED